MFTPIYYPYLILIDSCMHIHFLNKIRWLVFWNRFWILGWLIFLGRREYAIRWIGDWSLWFFYPPTHIYTIKVETINHFSPRLGPPCPSRRSHLSAQGFDERGCRPTKLIEEKCFHQNPNIFYTKHSYLPTFVPTCYFPLYRYEATIILGKTS